MRKLLLVLDDYRESSLFHTLLMKFGWDVKGISRDLLIKDEIIKHGPELIVAAVSGRQIDGIALSQKVARAHGLPRIILVGTAEELRGERMKTALAEGVLERPLTPAKVVQGVCEVCGLDVDSALKKLAQLMSRQDFTQKVEGIYVGSGEAPEESGDPREPAGADLLHDPARAEKYSRIAAQVSLQEGPQWDKGRVDRELKELRREADPALDELDENKRRFVRALFKKD